MKIKEPIKIGTSWEVSNGMNRSITSIDKTISTPLAEYKALEITTNGNNFTQKDYYVKEIDLEENYIILEKRN